MMIKFMAEKKNKENSFQQTNKRKFRLIFFLNLLILQKFYFFGEMEENTYER
jgi:hypothetical protein